MARTRNRRSRSVSRRNRTRNNRVRRSKSRSVGRNRTRRSEARRSRARRSEARKVTRRNRSTGPRRRMVRSQETSGKNRAQGFMNKKYLINGGGEYYEGLPVTTRPPCCSPLAVRQYSGPTPAAEATPLCLGHTPAVEAHYDPMIPPTLSFRNINSVWINCPSNKHLNGEYINIGGDHYVKDSKYHLNKNSENYWQIFVTIPNMSASQLNSEPDLEQVAKDGDEVQWVLAVYTDYTADEGEHPPTGKVWWTSSPTAFYLPAYAGPAHLPATFWLHEDDKDWMRVYSEGKFMWVEKKLSGGWWERRRGRGSRQKKEIGEPDDFSWTVEIEIIITVKDNSSEERSRLLKNRPDFL